MFEGAILGKRVRGRAFREITYRSELQGKHYGDIVWGRELASLKTGAFAVF